LKLKYNNIDNNNNNNNLILSLHLSHTSISLRGKILSALQYVFLSHINGSINIVLFPNLGNEGSFFQRRLNSFQSSIHTLYTSIGTFCFYVIVAGLSTYTLSPSHRKTASKIGSGGSVVFIPTHID